MANKKKGGVKAALRELAPGGISRSELKQIAKQTGASSQQIVKRMDAMNKAGQDVRLNSGAANMLIKQAQTTPSIIGQEPSFGTGNIGRALTSMMGTPGYPGAMIQGQRVGGQEAVPAQLMIGGTQIRPGGRTAVRPMGAAPAVSDTAADTTTAAGDGTTTAAGDGTMAGDQYDFQSMLDALTAVQQPQFDMGALTDMFNTQYEQLSSQFDSMNPLQLAQLGRAYGSDAIRARQRMRKTRQDYRRGLPAMALGQSLANLASMAIGGGVTL
jgi:hypothetical protein